MKSPQLTKLQKMSGTFLSNLCVCGLRRRFFGGEESAIDQAAKNVGNISFKLMCLRTAKKVFQGEESATDEAEKNVGNISFKLMCLRTVKNFSLRYSFIIYITT